ncbi:hypothetical protein OPV22_002332 [Ensete ventricosum]|uniref:Uncharacterized protein n=1 Tax=Ensete ventricosum TaxID=4639 RepID=A0AAV8RXN3_ENSVE|nr:hypothetical protein OPV22_002332 [Ensete ventricosum]
MPSVVSLSFLARSTGCSLPWAGYAKPLDGGKDEVEVGRGRLEAAGIFVELNCVPLGYGDKYKLNHVMSSRGCDVVPTLASALLGSVVLPNIKHLRYSPS